MAMSEKYDLRQMLKEIKEDETLAERKSIKLSQAEIGRLVAEKRVRRASRRHEGRS